jgi:uncharacterized membrane protein YgcG
MKKNWTYLIFILFLIFVITLIIINMHREEKFVPSNYVDISSNIITNVNDPSQCFNSCDVNPSCDGVTILQNKKTENYDCVLGLDNLSKYQYDKKNYTTPISYEKKKEQQEIIVYDDTYNPYYYNYYPQSLLPLYYPNYWRGGRGIWRDGKFSGHRSGGRIGGGGGQIGGGGRSGGGGGRIGGGGGRSGGGVGRSGGGGGIG